MNLRTRTKIALGILGSIVIGALGSGLWNGVLGPFCVAIGKGILNVVTLGIASLKDSMYRSAAEGLHEVPSLNVHLYVILFFVTTPIAFALFAVVGRRKLSAEVLAKVSVSKLERLLIAMTFIFALLGSGIFIEFLMNNQANLTITHFEQCLRICRPYIQADEQAQIESEFAQMRNKQDYVQVIAKLETIARNRSIKLPKFDPW